MQFRKWATEIVQSFAIKGFAMDDERLKNDGTILGKNTLKSSLPVFGKFGYPNASSTKNHRHLCHRCGLRPHRYCHQTFFATVQNKLHWAIHGHTAAELIMTRANAEKPNMGLTNWKDAPQGKIYPFDVVVAKNYLSDNELAQLQRLVSAYLDMAEDMAERQIPMTMADWETRLNRFLAATDREILQDAGKVTAEIAKSFALSEFEKYRVKQDLTYESDFDLLVKEMAAKYHAG